MAVAGDIPDFSAPLAADDVGGFAGADRRTCFVLPDALVAPGLERVDEGPSALSLTLERRADDPSADAHSGVLDLSLTAHYPLDEALLAARHAVEGATVRAIPIELGFIRLVQIGAAAALDPAVLAPQPLGWSAADGARWTQRLSPATALLFKGALQAQTLLVGARVEFAYDGLAAGAKPRVAFQPAALLQACGMQDGAVGYDDLLKLLTERWSALPMQAQNAEDLQGAPEALRDRLFAAFGELLAASSPNLQVRIGFAAPLIAEVAWDLSASAPGRRAASLSLDLSQALADADPARLVRELVIPPLDLGLKRVEIAANLPANRLGAPMIGARLSVPAAPPLRPSSISRTLTFTAPQDQADVDLRLAPSEALAYDLIPTVLLAAGAQVRECEGPPVRRTEAWVRLQPADFPARFAHLTLAPRLAGVAAVHGVLSYGTARLPFQLDAARPDLALVLPADAADPQITLQATPLGGGAPLDLPPMPPGRRTIDFADFPQYGPHRIAVSADLAPDDPPVTVALVAEASGSPGEVSLAPSSPASTWGYVAASPFAAGYRYRVGAGDWSDVQPPGAPLHLQREAAMARPSEPITIHGVRLYPEPGAAGRLLYVPAHPSAADGGGGRPAVSIVRTSKAVMLQVGAVLTLTRDDDAAVRQEVGAKAPLDLQPAPIQVSRAALRIADQTGAEHELAASTSSLYPPFSAVFAATLSPEDGARAIGAVNGAHDQLFVDYTVRLPADAVAAFRTPSDEITVRADVADWFPAGSGRDHIQILP